MATAEQIREGFKAMAKSDGPAVSNIAKVKSVDETKATCVLIDEDGQEFFLTFDFARFSQVTKVLSWCRKFKQLCIGRSCGG
ncbi:hypothetical protein [Flavobacterium sp. GNP001]